MSQLICEKLNIGYDGESVVKELNFKIERGNYLCVIGENGAGKSTLIKTLLGLIKPISGKITFGDGLSHSKIGYLPQQTLIQRDFPAGVFEVVLSGCQGRSGFRPFYRKEEKKLALECLDKMGVLELKNKCYRELSGGQQQRVLLARAILSARDIILLDEPVAGLDYQSTNEMYNLIKSLNADGVTVIMITHDINYALKYSSHILHIGGIPFFGTTPEFLNSNKEFNLSEVQK